MSENKRVEESAHPRGGPAPQSMSGGSATVGSEGLRVHLEDHTATSRRQSP